MGFTVYWAIPFRDSLYGYIIIIIKKPKGGITDTEDVKITRNTASLYSYLPAEKSTSILSGYCLAS